jgi:hypothetical protein
MNAIAAPESKTYVKDRHSAIAIEELIPGSAPNIVPAIIPRQMAISVVGSKTMAKPV